MIHYDYFVHHACLSSLHAHIHPPMRPVCSSIYIIIIHIYLLYTYLFIMTTSFITHVYHYCTHTYINRRAHPTHMPIAICHMRAGDHEETDLALAIRMQTEEMVQDALRASDGGGRRERDDVRYMHVCVYICIYVYMYTHIRI